MITAQEREWLQAAQEGDDDAFGLLHGVLAPPLNRFVRRLIGDETEADDVTQEALFTLYLHLKTLDPPEKMRPFLYRVARNRCYDILRRQGRYDHVSVDQDEDDLGSIRVGFELAEAHGDAPPEDATHWLLLMVEVREAMDRLPELQRQTLILFSEEDMSYDEIAQIMDVNIGTVKSRLFHARRGLRGLLRPRTMAAIDEELSTQVIVSESTVQADSMPPTKHKLTADDPPPDSIKGEVNHGTEHTGKTRSIRQRT